MKPNYLTDADIINFGDQLFNWTGSVLKNGFGREIPAANLDAARHLHEVTVKEFLRRYGADLKELDTQCYENLASYYGEEY